MSIPKIYALGHRYTQGIFDGPVVVQEKIDGSQFSFWVERLAGGRQLHCYSKSTEISFSNPGMFAAAVAKASELFQSGVLGEGYSYQCEYLAKPKHNVLAYSRCPVSNLVLFDVCHIGYFPPEKVAAIALALGLEPVPVLCEGVIQWPDECGVKLLESLLDRESVLGGQKIEGLVIKNYGKRHAECDVTEGDWHPRTAKLVSTAFKERHATAPRNPKTCGDVVQGIVNALRTEARWLKAVQHLRESGKLVNGPEDIGPLMKEIFTDLWSEQKEWIADQLVEGYRKQITSGVQAGFPDWYKKILATGLAVWQETQV